MAYADMFSEIRGCVPKLAISYAKTLVNRAYRVVRERNLWSFLLFEGQWIAPPSIGTGTVTTTQGLNTITFDATALAAINAAQIAQPYSLITQRQFRITPGGLYSIFAFDTATGIATLDRIYGEASVTGSSYLIYQAYYVPYDNSGPITDFKSWISVRDMARFNDLFTDRMTQENLNATDPQRMSFTVPTDVVPYQRDQNPASAAYGAFRFELWGHPLFNITYQLYGLRRGTDLVSPADTIPPALGEDCVLALARSMAYEWAEANKDMSPRSSGPDFRFLMGASLKEYDTLLKMYRSQDRATVDNWFSVRRSSIPTNFWPYYSTLSGTANPGRI